MGQTKNFFREKKAWSFLKDEILDYYLVPYIAKILRTGKPLVIIDCFAGKGKFDNGQNGSPLIIAEHIKGNIQKNPYLSGKLKGTFIEKKYSAELKNNLISYPNATILDGSFEENLQKIIALNRESNIFLYVDPYGIKSLTFNLFSQIRDKNFFSLEMLMNFNSAGFLREGCRLLKDADAFGDDELTDYESDDETNTVDRMNSIAGGIYWHEIVNEYYKKTIDIYQAEEMFISEYSRKLQGIFKYTVNIPIKQKSSHLPKYRLVFGSNHADGLILMANNMNKKWKEMQESQRDPQQVFDFAFPDYTALKGYDLHEDILTFISANSTGMQLKELIVGLIQKYGINFSESEYQKKIRQMEQNSELAIDRVPSKTPTGKPATAMDYGKYKITVKKRI